MVLLTVYNYVVRSVVLNLFNVFIKLGRFFKQSKFWFIELLNDRK